MAYIKNIDNFDKKILDLLIWNSNLSLQSLSNKLNRSKSFVSYRIKNLLNKGLIEQIYPIIDISKLGAYVIDVYIRTNMNEEREVKFIEFLKNQNTIYYIERLIGRYSMRISFLSENLKNSIVFIKECFKDFTESLEEVNLFIVQSIIKTRNPMFNTVKGNKPLTFFNVIENTTLSAKEVDILRIINDNPRISVLEISSKTGFSRKFIDKTIKKFISDKLVVGYSIDVDTEKFGYISKLFMIKLRFLSLDNFEELKRSLISISEVQTLTTYFPENYLSIEVNLRGERELRDLQIKILNEYKKYVESIEILDYYDEQKYSYMDDFLRGLQKFKK